MNLGSIEIGILLITCLLPILLVVAIGVYLISRRRALFASRRKCPFCAEWIMPEAVVCRYCGREVQPVTVKQDG